MCMTFLHLYNFYNQNLIIFTMIKPRIKTKKSYTTWSSQKQSTNCITMYLHVWNSQNWGTNSSWELVTQKLTTHAYDVCRGQTTWLDQPIHVKTMTGILRTVITLHVHAQLYIQECVTSNYSAYCLTEMVTTCNLDTLSLFANGTCI